MGDRQFSLQSCDLFLRRRRELISLVFLRLLRLGRHQDYGALFSLLGPWSGRLVPSYVSFRFALYRRGWREGVEHFSRVCTYYSFARMRAWSETILDSTKFLPPT